MSRNTPQPLGYQEPRFWKERQNSAAYKAERAEGSGQKAPSITRFVLQAGSEVIDVGGSNVESHPAF
jgi:hypothetical protein